MKAARTSSSAAPLAAFPAECTQQPRRCRSVPRRSCTSYVRVTRSGLRRSIRPPSTPRWCPTMWSSSPLSETTRTSSRPLSIQSRSLGSCLKTSQLRCLAFVGPSRNSTGSCMRPDVDTNLRHTPSPMGLGWVAKNAARHGVGQMFRHCGLVDDFAEKLS